MEKQHNIFDLMLIFARQKKIIIWVTAIVSIAAVIYSIITPQIWTSRATFKPDASTSMGLSAAVPGLSGIVTSLMGVAGADAQSALIILKSRSVNEDVINRFNLIKYFKIKDPDSLLSMDLALQKVRKKMLSAGLNEENGLITIAVSTKDKMLSKNMTEYYLTKLDTYNREFKLTKGKRNRQFLEERVKTIRADIDSLTITLRDFQKKNKAIDITSQMSSVVALYSDAVSRKMVVDLQLDIAKMNYKIDSPVVKELIQKQQLMADKISEIEKSPGTFKPGYIIDINKIPDLTQKYAQLMINLEIQKKIYEYLYPQYEAARIEELKDMPTIEVIDNPRLAGLRSYPRRATLCIMAAFLGFLLSLIIAYIKHQMEQNSTIVTQIKNAVFKPKKI